jgi:membrane associated rhomboid family serine protease
MLNAPPVVAWTLAALLAIHMARWLLSPEDDVSLLLLFAFLPARYDPSFVLAAALPGGDGPKIWTFVTYAGLHADLTHLGVNAIWLLAFGSPVAWRFGGARFLLFSAVTAAAGAATHLLTHFGQAIPMVGASAMISGLTAAAIRFVFTTGGPLGAWRRSGPAAFSVPATPLAVVLRMPQVIGFLGVWFGINLLYGVGAASIGPEGASIAWQAHIGGFLAGLVLFPLFDPPPRGGTAYRSADTAA